MSDGDVVIGDHVDTGTYGTGKVVDIDLYSGWALVELDTEYQGTTHYNLWKGNLRKVSRVEEPNGIDVYCRHDWKDYMGLTHVYRYCSYCDAKQFIED